MSIIKRLENYIEIIGDAVYREILPYWIEGTEKVWTKLSLVADDNEIYVYYGNENAPDYSNGDEVFEIFDDFDGNEIDSNKWTTYEEITISNSMIHIPTGPSPHPPIRTNYKFDRDIIVEALVKSSSYGSYTVSIIWDDDDGDINTYSEHSVISSSGLYWKHCTSSYSNTQVYAFTPQSNEFYKLKLILTPDKIGVFVNNNGQFYVNEDNTGEKYIAIDSYDGGGADVDYIFIRKYIDQEPTVTYGGEEIGHWTINGYTYTKRKKVTINSTTVLTDFQIALDYSQFQTNKIVVTK